MPTRHSIPTELFTCPTVVWIPVQWGDIDQMGHVNNTLPIRWFETARIRFLEDAGVGDMITGNGLGPILAAIHCNYRQQIRYPDTVCVSAKAAQIGRTSIKVEHKVFSDDSQSVAAEGESIVVVFDYEKQRPVRVSDELRELIERIQSQYEQES